MEKNLPVYEKQVRVLKFLVDTHCCIKNFLKNRCVFSSTVTEDFLSYSLLLLGQFFVGTLQKPLTLCLIDVKDEQFSKEKLVQDQLLGLLRIIEVR